MQPEAFDCLPPERITAGGPPDRAGDVYACGCVWQHLLCGRPPLAGGDALSKLRAVQTAAIDDVRRLAPATPAELAEAIAACVQRDPHRRPESIAALAQRLGPDVASPAEAGRPATRRTGTFHRRLGRPRPNPRRTSRQAVLAALALIVAVAIAWPLWQRKGTGHLQIVRTPAQEVPLSLRDDQPSVGAPRGEGKPSRDSAAAGARFSTRVPLTLTLSRRERGT